MYCTLLCLISVAEFICTCTCTRLSATSACCTCTCVSQQTASICTYMEARCWGVNLSCNQLVAYEQALTHPTTLSNGKTDYIIAFLNTPAADKESISQTAPHKAKCFLPPPISFSSSVRKRVFVGAQAHMVLECWAICVCCAFLCMMCD